MTARQRELAAAEETAAEMAINEALMAEQQAMVAVQGCQEEAERILFEARGRAAEIDLLADQEVSAIQKNAAKQLHHQVTDLQDEHRRNTAFEARDDQPGPDMAPGLAKTVARLVSQLTGGDLPPPSVGVPS